jgi:hypothetical protein
LIDAALLDCGFPEASRPVYKKGWGQRQLKFTFLRAAKTLTFLVQAARLLVCSPCSCFAGELARVKQTVHRRRRYVAMPSSSSSAATTPMAETPSEGLSGGAAAELHPGDTVEFGVSRMSSGRVQDLQQLGYFGGGVRCVPGAEEIPEPEGELVVFEAFFVAGLRLPAHHFVSEVLQKFGVQGH